VGTVIGVDKEVLENNVKKGLDDPAIVIYIDEESDEKVMTDSLDLSNLPDLLLMQSNEPVCGFRCFLYSDEILEIENG
jgi:hypothetical protein